VFLPNVINSAKILVFNSIIIKCNSSNNYEEKLYKNFYSNEIK